MLAPFGDVVVAPADDEATLRSLAADAVALIVRGGCRVSAAVIDGADGLRVVGRSGIGVDEVDLEAATRRGIPVVVTPRAGAQAVAEGALALMLALAKRLPELDRAVRDGRWAHRDECELGDLAGSTLGIVGLGRIGTRLADLGVALGMDVAAHDPWADALHAHVPLVGLDELFARSRFLSLHAPLTDETRGMVDGRLLALVPRGAIFVNLARGGLLRSLDDLVAALDSGRLAGVGLDVFEPEPADPRHPIFSRPNVLAAPHALGMSLRARERIWREMAEGMLAALRGERPRAVANPEVFA